MPHPAALQGDVWRRIRPKNPEGGGLDGEEREEISWWERRTVQDRLPFDKYINCPRVKVIQPLLPLSPPLPPLPSPPPPPPPSISFSDPPLLSSFLPCAQGLGFLPHPDTESSCARQEKGDRPTLEGLPLHMKWKVDDYIVHQVRPELPLLIDPAGGGLARLSCSPLLPPTRPSSQLASALSPDLRPSACPAHAGKLHHPQKGPRSGPDPEDPEPAEATAGRDQRPRQPQAVGLLCRRRQQVGSAAQHSTAQHSASASPATGARGSSTLSSFPAASSGPLLTNAPFCQRIISGVLRLTELSRAIESHKTVIRINQAPTYGYSRRVGRKVQRPGPTS